MGFRYRKSINLGGGFRINLSKSGIGYSWVKGGFINSCVIYCISSCQNFLLEYSVLQQTLDPSNSKGELSNAI